MKTSGAGLGLLLALGIGGVSAAPIVSLASPVKSELRSDSVVCTHPESLYLLYEGSSIAMAGGGDVAFQAYFNAAGSVFERRAECLVQAQVLQVTVDAYSTMVNPLKPDPVIYGRFGVEGADDKVWATIQNLPAFEAESVRTGLIKPSAQQATAATR